ncbi:acyl CoA:acetate/3-ketoacid CoA transferase [Muricomes sp. OA1]|uniref:Acyl CoA:acetate/3-ketoacid CoA transferase n=1 Tax=Hungatella hathewayi TaxID=154046 RepID=A0A3E2WL47_9FIRM|nr:MULTISPECIES: CoA-transferase [Clostridia]MCH1971963.1 acyl CoA:acetate/3-ketoacid CoA transferase [Muricomes sp. OA1]MEE0201709.1 CoA-transferase [Muricomes sp.]RGC27779.1 acyl CoA:acetate/3-ketoacid CoA transferase [Hungatella hathewayi]GKH30763.1 propionate CoA-transferase [Faecalicatena contorta]
MLKANFVSAKEAAAKIKDGNTVCTIAMTLVSASESILKELEKSYLDTGHPSNLTLLHSCGQSDRKDGIQHLAHEGMVTKIIGSHWGLQPRWMEMIANSQVEAYCLPQGQIAQLYRSMACGLPGKMSKVGLGTFIDPRVEGGKMNERTKPLKDIVDIIEYAGEEYMFYKQIPIDVCVIRGTVCDEMGNLTTTEEAMKLEVLPAVLAAKRYGGIVIAQVKQVVQTGTINPKDVTVPGVFIDHIVVCENPREDHRQTSSWYFDPSYCGQVRVPQGNIPPAPFNERKFIARRGTQELYDGAVVNLGTGIPNDMVGKVCNEEGVSDDIMITVESGIYGGVQAGGIDFGIGQNLYAMIGHHEQMDYYNGAGVDITYMGLGELGEDGSVNSTRMGSRCTGAGGFIDITQNAKKVVFLGTFTASGAKYQFADGRLTILQEGKIRKMVKQVAQLSFNGPMAREKGQEVTIVTERAVFCLCKEGVELIEIAPGIDLQTQVLDMMDFQPLVSPKLKLMDERLFIEDGPFGLKLKEKSLNIKGKQID